MALGSNLVYPDALGQPVPVAWASGFTQAYAISAPVGTPFSRRNTWAYRAWPILEFLLLFHFICQFPQNSKFTPVRGRFPKCSETKIKWTTGEKIEYPLIMIIKLSTLQQMLLEYLTRKGNYCRNLECCQVNPTDKPLTMNLHLETKHDLVCETFRDHTKACGRWQRCWHCEHWHFLVWGNNSVSPSFAACIKCEFLAFPSNGLVLDFWILTRFSFLVWF